MSASPGLMVHDPDWWRGAVIYQIYPRSFQDSNGDGIGDLRGVTGRMDYIASLGVDAIWLSPFFKSPMADFGYDISDYRDVDPMFGTLADFRDLLDAAHERGVRVLIDLVISHTSDQHPWFRESRFSLTNSKADWYVWADPKPDGTPPTNWLSIFGGSAWEWNATRQQYFLHNFLTSQPDLNFHNQDVQDAMLDVVRFWLDFGVDGFRLDTVNFYFHDKELRDNPPLPERIETATVPMTNPYSRQFHLYDKTRPENLVFLERLRALLDEYRDITTVGELGLDEDLYARMAEYTEGGRRLHMAYSFELLTYHYTAAYIRSKVDAMEKGVGGGWPSWALSNHDFKRVISRWGGENDPDAFAPMAAALVTCLRGTACIYQGDELGLTEADVPFELLQDPYGIRFWPEFKGRDGCRTPMVWQRDNAAAGFSNQPKTWLPIPPEHLGRAALDQEGKPDSALERIRTFLKWRKTVPALVKGAMEFIDAPEPLLAFIRAEVTERVVVVINLSPETLHAELSVVDHAEPLTGHGFAGHKNGKQLVLPGRGIFFGRLHH